MYKGIITTPTAVTANTDIVFQTAVNTNNKVISNNGALTFTHPGIWDVEANIVAVNSATGEISAQFYANGITIPEAIATETVSSIGRTVTLPLRDALAVIKSYGLESAKLSVRLSQDATINSAIILAELRR